MTPQPDELALVSEHLPDRLRRAAQRVSNHCFRQSGESSLMTIPAQPGYDVDLLLIEAAEAIERLRSVAGGEAAGRWVAWKPGDALPEPGVYHCTGSSRVHLLRHSFEFEDTKSLSAYWSQPLPPPYTPPPPSPSGPISGSTSGTGE